MPRRPLHQLAPSGATDGQAPLFAGTADEYIPGDVVLEIVEGTGVTVDATDPQRPVVSATGGEGWTQTIGPVLTPSGAVEATSVQEPEVLHPDPAGVAQLRMYYMGGWSTPRLFAATSDDDGQNWTRANSGNPVLGGGAGGESGKSAHAGVVVTPAGEVHVFYTDQNDLTPTNIYAVKSTDGGLTFGSKRTILTPSGWEIGVWGNCGVVIDAAGVWHLLYEGFNSSHIWQMGYATSPDGITWTRQNGGSPVTGLQVGTGMVGGPNLHQTADGWELFYHASPSGNLPTDIYHATSTDLINWTPTSTTPVVTREQSFEVDQVADASVVVIDGVRVMFFDAVDNPSSASNIGRAVEVGAWAPRYRSIATDDTLTGGGDLSGDRVLGVDLDAEEARVQALIDASGGGGRWEVLMASGVSFPAEPVESSAGGDWLYGEVS